MSIDRIVLAFSGTLVVTGLLFGTYVHPNWLFLSGFAGLNMFQAAFTRFCPLAFVLKKAGVASGPAFG